MIELIKPSKELYIQYKDMMDEWHKEGGKIAPWPLSLDYEDKEKFDKTLKYIEEVETDAPEGFPTSSTYWVYDRERNILIGATNIRHKIVGESGKLWGHIGYGIRPSERRKGYATETLKLAMEKTKEFGIKTIYVGAYTDNVGSVKTIESCGFDFEDTLIDNECGKEVRKYSYSYRKKFTEDTKMYGSNGNVDIKVLEWVSDIIYGFMGDIWIYKFNEVEKEALLPSGKPFLASGYTWIEFYDYRKNNRLTAMYDENKQIVEWYFDVARKIGKDAKTNTPYEDDLYLDVIFMPDGSSIVLDQDELEEAYKTNQITEEDYRKAIAEADRIKMETDIDSLKNFTDKWKGL